MQSTILVDNIDFSKEWLTEEIIKTYLREKKNNSVEIIKIKKIDLLKLVLNFVKLNEKGE